MSIGTDDKIQRRYNRWKRWNNANPWRRLHMGLPALKYLTGAPEFVINIRKGTEKAKVRRLLESLDEDHRLLCDLHRDWTNRSIATYSKIWPIFSVFVNIAFGVFVYTARLIFDDFPPTLPFVLLAAVVSIALCWVGNVMCDQHRLIAAAEDAWTSTLAEQILRSDPDAFPHDLNIEESPGKIRQYSLSVSGLRWLMSWLLLVLWLSLIYLVLSDGSDSEMVV